MGQMRLLDQTFNQSQLTRVVQVILKRWFNNRYKLGYKTSSFRLKNGLIHLLEKYLLQTGGLPASLIELEVPKTESDPLYYQRKNATTYEVWYFIRRIRDLFLADEKVKQLKEAQCFSLVLSIKRSSINLSFISCFRPFT
jgi:hypothetical protein